MKKIVLIAIVVFGLSKATAQSYTWAENTACIFYTNCTKCHFPGGPGPFSLLDYGNAFAARFAIKAAVLSGYMPPWQPDETYQTYAHERLLTQTEKNIIVAWVDQGAPQGNLANAPTPPSYSGVGSQLPSIDFTGGVGYYTNAAPTDDYRVFYIPTHLGVDEYIESIEMLPGSHNMVHHALIYIETDTAAIMSQDSADAGMGYTNFGGTGVSGSKLMYTSIPGVDPLTYPAGMGVKLDANAWIIVQLHYPAGTTGLTDSNTVINLKFASGSVREVSLAPVLDFIYPSQISPWPLHISPNSTASFVETYTLPSVFPWLDQYTVLNVQPHMHKVGQSMKVYAVTPLNDTIPLCYLPSWDFAWQGQYTFRQPIVLDEGTVIKAEGFYNNTASNINAPNPSLNVYGGTASDAEMMQVYFSFLYYQAGDENIIIDTVTVHPTYNGCQFVGIEDEANSFAQFKIYPNPTNDIVNLSLEQYEQGDLKISVIDMSGKVLSEFIQPQVGVGTINKTLDLRTLSPGIYYVRVLSGTTMFAKPLVVAR